MSDRTDTLPGEVTRETYWDWVAAALFLLLPVDLVTTLYAAAAVGAEHEANPWMSVLLTRSVPTIIAVHVAVALAAIAGFYGYETVSRRSESHGPVMIRAARVYLFLLVCAGFLVFVNNLAVILTGGSVLGALG